MALKQVFVDPNALKKIHTGPLVSKIDGFSEWLSKYGFARSTIRRHILNVSHFSRYLKQKNSLIQPLLIPVIFDNLSQNISLIVTTDAQEQNIITGSLFRFIVL